MPPDQPSRESSFVEAYLLARGREQRLLPDEVVATLPDIAVAPGISAGDPRCDEWRQRADSSTRLARHLSDLNARRRLPLTVWEIGCGNGWLAARLASVPDVSVVGFDVNIDELEQARRVFGERDRLRFAPGDIGALPDQLRAARGDGPDIVVMASVLQYVIDPNTILRRAVGAAVPGTEFHVLDSPLYADTSAVDAARQRTRDHYELIGVPTMADHYHHHTWDAFAGLRTDVLYRPDAPATRLQRRVLRQARSPFPWVRITAGAPR